MVMMVMMVMMKMKKENIECDTIDNEDWRDHDHGDDSMHFTICICIALLTQCGSLYRSSIGADGARALGEALKVNTTLTSLE